MEKNCKQQVKSALVQSNKCIHVIINYYRHEQKHQYHHKIPPPPIFAMVHLVPFSPMCRRPCVDEIFNVVTPLHVVTTLVGSVLPPTTPSIDFCLQTHNKSMLKNTNSVSFAAEFEAAIRYIYFVVVFLFSCLPFFSFFSVIPVIMLASQL